MTEETGVTVYNHDPAVELAQAESICREWLPFTRDGEAMCWVMVEYDRRGVELEQLRAQRAAVLALHTRAAWRRLNGTEIASCDACQEKWPCPTVTALGGEA